MDEQLNKMYLPGDVITKVTSHKGVTVLGPGLRYSGELDYLTVTKCGTLRYKQPNIYWLDHKQQKYIPQKGDFVVGVIARKAGDTFKVDIGAAEHALLSVFAFEGATKKQRPDLQIGDAIYGRLLTAHREMEPEIVCVNKYFKAANMGQLSVDGFIVRLKLDFVHRLLSVDNPLLRTLGKKYAYEIAVGLNGKVWINCKNHEHILHIVNALFAAQECSDNDIVKECLK